MTTRFAVHTSQTAPAAAAPVLDNLKKAWGFVPNLHAVMAESPALLAGYNALWDLFTTQSSFTPAEQQVVMMTANGFHGCEYCMSGHTGLAKMQGVPAEVIRALRDQVPIADAKLATLQRFTRSVIENRGWVDPSEVDAFIAGGYTKAQALEVILGVATKVLSNYTNHLADTPLDAFMKGNEWKRPVANAA